MKGKAVSLEVSHEQKGFRKVWQFLFSCWIQSEYPKPCQDSLFLFYVDVEHEDLAANIPHDLSDWIETFTPRHCSYRNINMLILKIDHQDWDLSGQHHLMLKQGIWFWQAPIGGCLHVINTSIKRNVQVENEAGVFCLISHETGQLLLLEFFFNSMCWDIPCSYDAFDSPEAKPYQCDRQYFMWKTENNSLVLSKHFPFFTWKSVGRMQLSNG